MALRNLPLRRKLMLVIGLATGVALLANNLLDPDLWSIRVDFFDTVARALAEQVALLFADAVLTQGLELACCALSDSAGGVMGDARSVEQDRPSARKHRFAANVLLAEDNPVNREIAAALLHALGCTVSTVDDGAQALAAIQRGRFDLVLMDCQMPVMDGFEATRRIRAWEAGQPGVEPVRIVALTANALAGDRETCLAAGMDDYLAKPIASTRLAEMLARWVDPDAQAPAVASGRRAGAPADLPAPEPVPVFDPSVLHALPMVADGSQPEYADEVLEMYAESLAASLDQIDAAHAAADSRRMLQRMHALKSSSAQVGAAEISALAARFEGELRAGQPASSAWPGELRAASARLHRWRLDHPWPLASTIARS